MAKNTSTAVSGNVRFRALSESLIRMEYSPEGKFIDEPSVAVINRDDWPKVEAKLSEDGDSLQFSTGKITIQYKKNSGPFSESNIVITWTDCDLKKEWKMGDTDEGNLGGIPASLDNRSMKTVTDPGPLSRKGCYFLDDSHTALFDKATDWVKPRPTKDSQDLFFMVYGTDYAAALKTLSDLTGKIPMLPRYVFGSWFGSRAGYSSDEWKMIVKQFRDEKLPLDVLVLDSDSTTNMVWAGYDWDYEQMPDPKEFFNWLKDRGVKTTVNEHYNPLTKINDRNFEIIRKKMGLPKDATEIAHNIGDKKYAELFMDLLHKPAFDEGMAFWWQDGAAGCAMEGLDPYLWTRHVEYEGSEKITGKRTTAFCRLGPAVGSHRYGVFFTGDLHGIWESLPVLIPATVRGGNQLVPYMNNLCGGVFTVDLPVELYQRCIQFGAFSPVIWFHGLWGLRLPWEYGPEGIEAYRKFVGLRYELIPYIYTYSRIAYDSGLPLVRGTFLEYPDQEGSYTHDQQYMFGKEFLVAPITAPATGPSATKEVFLPATNDWFDYFTGDIYAGGQVVVHESPIDRMPLFVRSNSIIPSGPQMDYSDQAQINPLTLDVFVGGATAEFNLYEDDGDSLAYRKGKYAWISLSFAPAKKRGEYALIVHPSQGAYKGMLKQRAYEIRVHGLCKPSSVKANGGTLTELEPGREGRGWSWDAAKRVALISLPKPLSTSRPVTITLCGAGTFADSVTIQKALNLRQQVRQAKRVMKLRHAEILAGPGIKKPPRVIRVTEEVENQLTDLIDNPKNAAGKAPDFDALQKKVLNALTNQPFEAKRKIPEIDPESIQGTQISENAEFLTEQIESIKKILRGAELPAWVYPE